MDIYLTDTASNRLTIPILPDRVSIKTGALTQTYQTLNVGEIRMPRGSSLTGYSWNGIFPGANMAEHVVAFGRTWQSPQEIIATLQRWQSNGEKLHLMITETEINDDVFIEQFHYDYSGMGNVTYTLNLERYITMTLYTAPLETITAQYLNGVTFGAVSTPGCNLNVRKRPSTGSAIIGTLINNQHVDITGVTGNWYEIVYEAGDNHRGYVYVTYIAAGVQGIVPPVEQPNVNGEGYDEDDDNNGGGNGHNGNGYGGGGGPNGSGSQNDTGPCDYVTGPHDTIYNIAKNLGVSANELYKLNAAKLASLGYGIGDELPAGIGLMLPARKQTVTPQKPTRPGAVHDQFNPGITGHDQLNPGAGSAGKPNKPSTSTKPNKPSVPSSGTHGVVDEALGPD